METKFPYFLFLTWLSIICCNKHMSILISLLTLFAIKKRFSGHTDRQIFHFSDSICVVEL